MTQRNLSRTAIYEKRNNKSLPAWIIMSLIVGTIFGVTISGKQNTDNTTLSSKPDMTALLPRAIA